MKDDDPRYLPGTNYPMLIVMSESALTVHHEID
jgi:hypothetical protein